MSLDKRVYQMLQRAGRGAYRGSTAPRERVFQLVVAFGMTAVVVGLSALTLAEKEVASLADQFKDPLQLGAILLAFGGLLVVGLGFFLRR